MANVLDQLLFEIKKCTLCTPHLPLGPNPVVSFNANSKIIIIGQAPGSIVHQSGIPWDDASGNRLREWLGVGEELFYNPDHFAIVPMGFCYPGKGKSGDLPPRKECAQTWHNQILGHLKSAQLILLIGQYAQNNYLQTNVKKNLTETVKGYKEYLPEYFPLPHPSPRNNIWLRKNPWMEDEVIPHLKKVVEEILSI